MPAKFRDESPAIFATRAIPSSLPILSTAVPLNVQRARACALALALALITALSVDAAGQPPRKPAAAIGHIDQPSLEIITDPASMVSGWALSKQGIDRIEVVVDGRERIGMNYGVARPDVKAVHAGYPDSENAGFEARLRLGHLSMGRHELEIIATDRANSKTTLGRRIYVNQSFRELWADLLAERGHRPNDVFHFVFATSHVAEGGAAGIDTEYAPFLSETMKVGVRVPILYMRTTLGREHDWTFDPDFEISRACGKRKIAEDSLNNVITWSIDHKVPVLFTLNGGIWADAACDVPDWDINDQLEQDLLNCQWNEHNEVMPDDYLRHLPGSQDAPELARALTLNVYAGKVRYYKKRNLQHAARIIKAFADGHPELFIGVSLDPDVYMNPFFEGTQWYDYNPGTLRQFQEWLRGSGPYAGKPPDGVPDLSNYRIAKPYSLASINQIAGKVFRKWSEVDPPRVFKPEETELKKPWTQVWERFRRHVVDLHYDELSQWVAETGIDASQIFSSQGFNAPGPAIEPFPLRIDSPAKNYDTGGMSVQGAVPAKGHLGAILYGESAIDNIRMEEHESLFRVFRKFDPDWAVVEYNPAMLQTPRKLPDARRAYHGLRDILNFGARLVSPMAWNGSPGTAVGKPGFVAYTSYRAAPLEKVARNLMVHRANLPRQARLWGFGLGIVDDTDDWKATSPVRVSATSKGLQIKLRQGRTRIDSPSALDFRTNALDLLVLGFKEAPADLTVAVEGRERGKRGWMPLTESQRTADLRNVRAGHLVSLPHSTRQLEQLRLVFESKTGGPVTLERVALYPIAAAPDAVQRGN
jgi:hypothetical protein